MSSLKPCPQAEAIAQEIADNSGWSKRTNSYSMIYQGAFVGASRAFRAPIPVTDEMVERAMVAVAIEMGHTAESFAEKRKSDFEGTAKNRRAMRAALTAALGGGNGNV